LKHNYTAHNYRFFLWIPKSAFLLLIFFMSCYTYEFKPVEEYPNLKKSDIKEVVITMLRPKKPINELGQLTLRDFSGDIHDPAFQKSIRRQAKKRGAEGAWISKIQTKETVRLQSRTDYNRRNYMQNNYYGTSQVKGEMNIVEIILFNYIETDSFLDLKNIEKK